MACPGSSFSFVFPFRFRHAARSAHVDEPLVYVRENEQQPAPACWTRHPQGLSSLSPLPSLPFSPLVSILSSCPACPALLPPPSHRARVTGGRAKFALSSQPAVRGHVVPCGCDWARRDALGRRRSLACIHPNTTSATDRRGGTQIPPPPESLQIPPPNSQLFVPATGNSYPSVTSFGLGCRLLSHPVRSCAAGRLCLSDSRASTTAGGMNEAERLSILARRVRATDKVLNQEGEWQVHGRPAPTYPPTLAFAQQPTGVLTLWYPTRAGVCEGSEASTSRSEVGQPGSNERRGAPRRTPAAADTPHE
jgi:hypothetical protein